MRMIYKSHKTEVIGLFRSHLESVGIQTLTKNQFTDGTWPADPDCPELWVTDDRDYDRAIETIQTLGVS